MHIKWYCRCCQGRCHHFPLQPTQWLQLYSAIWIRLLPPFEVQGCPRNHPSMRRDLVRTVEMPIRPPSNVNNTINRHAVHVPKRMLACDSWRIFGDLGKTAISQWTYYMSGYKGGCFWWQFSFSSLLSRCYCYWVNKKPRKSDRGYNYFQRRQLIHWYRRRLP